MKDDVPGLLTFLFTDIEGSVRLWERSPERMARLLERHREIVAASSGAHRGALIRERGEGDSTFSTYPSPADAAAAVAALQRALHAEPWPEDMVIRVRAALHTGAAYAADPGAIPDYNSPTVNRCARLRALAHGGQTLLSETTFHLLCDALTEVPARDLGLHRLRDLRRPEHVYQLLYPPVPDSFPPLAGPQSTPGNLPPPAGRFLGRREEMAVLPGLTGPGRLLTLTGMGGIGKTRLALEVARAGAGDYPDGVWLADLSPETEGGRLAGTLAATLQARVEPGQTPEEALTGRLAVCRPLLILDSCERLRPDCARLAAHLLAVCPHLTLLATSQAPLGMAGETVFSVRPLAVPPVPTPPLAALAETDSVGLFVERAQAAAPGFALTARNAEAVAEVCRRVDGLPLALELAAACLSFLGVGPLAQRLADPFPVFAGVADGEETPRRTLLGVLDSSFQLLSSEPQAVLRRLAVFEGAWSLEAAEAICEPSAPGGGLLAALAPLVRRSLVAKQEEDGIVRYRLPRIVRLYARRRLAEAGEASDAERRHWEHFSGLARQAVAGLDGDEAGDWLDLLERERLELEAALRRAADAFPAEGLAVAIALYPFWSLRGHARAGRDLIARLQERAGPAETADGARADTAAGALAWGQGDFPAARAAFARALATRQRLEDVRGAADVLNNLGTVAWDQGHFEEARDLFLRSLETLEALGDAEGIAVVCGNLGWLYCDLEDDGGAARLFERALDGDRQRRDLSGVANGLDGQGEVALRRGDGARARMLREEALKLRRQVRDRVGIAESLEGLAAVHATLNDPARAATLLGAAERQREVLESPLPPRQRPPRQRLVSALRASLPDGYHDAWTRGYGLSWEQAAEAALAEDPAVALADACLPDPDTARPAPAGMTGPSISAWDTPERDVPHPRL